MKSLPEIVKANKETKATRGRKAGERMADSIVEMVHMMYQLRTARHFLSGLISRIEHLSKEFDA